MTPELILGNETQALEDRGVNAKREAAPYEYFLSRLKADLEDGSPQRTPFDFRI